MKLYAKNNQGKMQIWFVEKTPGGFTMFSGLLGRKITAKHVAVLEGKAGRSWVEQVQLEIDSRIKKKMDAGFVTSEYEASIKLRYNALGFIRPMLAKTGSPTLEPGSFVQYKYDGLRCLITCRNGKNVAYSRGGKLYDAIDHITDVIKIPEGVTIDGELYRHGYALQDINSWAKRKQENTKRLKFMAYDVVSTLEYKSRHGLLKLFDLGNENIVVPTWKIENLDLSVVMRTAREKGYEGLIIRQPNYSYEDGKRSSSLIKIKEFYDENFRVMGVTKSKEGYGILHLISKYGDAFKVLSPGTHEQKRSCIITPELVVGKLVEVQYANLSNKGIPIQPVAKRFVEVD